MSTQIMKNETSGTDESTPPEGFFHGKTHHIFQVEGPHAGRYLQARTTNDVLRLAATESCLAACLDAQGKLEALFTVYCVEPKNSYLLVADGGELKENESNLLRFKVADQFEATFRSDLTLLHLSITDSSRSNLIQERINPFAAIPSKRLCYAGSDLIVPIQQLDEGIGILEEDFSSLSREQLAKGRILGNRPWFPIDLPPKTLFLEALSLNAISSTKGCYAGQEVVEKALARGKPPTLLSPYRIEGKLIEPGEVLLERGSDKRIGQLVTRTSPSPESNEYLAFVRIRTEFQEQPELQTDSVCLSLLKAHS